MMADIQSQTYNNERAPSKRLGNCDGSTLDLGPG